MGRILIFLIVFVVTGSSVPVIAQNQDPDWALKKDAEGIKVYTRTSHDSKLDEFKGEATIATTKEKLVKVLQDADRLQDWIPDCAFSKLISLNGDEQYHYLISSLPFPLSNRDTYVHFKYTSGPGWVKVIMTGLPDYAQEEKKLVRIPYLVGFWLFKQVAPDETHVTYQLHADPGGAIPNWLANSTTVTTPYNTLKNLRKYVE